MQGLSSRSDQAFSDVVRLLFPDVRKIIFAKKMAVFWDVIVAGDESSPS